MGIAILVYLFFATSRISFGYLNLFLKTASFLLNHKPRIEKLLKLEHNGPILDYKFSKIGRSPPRISVIFWLEDYYRFRHHLPLDSSKACGSSFHHHGYIGGTLYRHRPNSYRYYCWWKHYL